MPKTPDQVAEDNARRLRAAAERAELQRKSLHDLGWTISDQLLYNAQGLPYFVCTVPAGINKKIPHGQTQSRTFQLDGAVDVRKL